MLDLQPLRLDSLAAANTVLATLPLFVDGRALIPRAASRGEDKSQTMDMVPKGVTATNSRIPTQVANVLHQMAFGNY